MNSEETETHIGQDHEDSSHEVNDKNSGVKQLIEPENVNKEDEIQEKKWDPQTSEVHIGKFHS